MRAKSVLRVLMIGCLSLVFLILLRYLRNDCVIPDHSVQLKQQRLYRQDRWVIVDASKISKRDLQDLEDVPGWRLLIYGEGVTQNFIYRCENCMFIDDWSIPNFQYIFREVNNPHLMACLYAIRNGAQWIYLTKNLTNVVDDLNGYQFDDRTKGLLYQGDVTFDPDAHFGFNTRKPRSNKQFLYQAGIWKTPTIQKKWRPSKKASDLLTSESIVEACRLPRAYIPADLYPSQSLWGHVVGYKSFWSLRALADLSQEMVWTEWWKRLMRTVEGTIGVLPLSCTTSKTLHPSETKQSPVLLTKAFRCTATEKFNQCAFELVKMINESVTIDESEVKLTRAWFSALADVNYQEPLLKTVTRDSLLQDRVNMPSNFWFEPSTGRHSAIRESPFKDICPTRGVNNSPRTPLLHDIVLVVTFNKPFFYHNIRFTDYMYHQYFSKIVYCGHRMNTFLKFKKTYEYPVTFLEVEEIQYGVFFEMCAAHAMRLGYNVSGYLAIGDDVLLNMWNLANIPRERFWFQPSIRNASLERKWVPNLTKANKVSHWWPWGDGRWGVNGLKVLWSKFRRMKSTEFRSVVNRFMVQIESNFGAPNGAFYQASDIYYVPQKYSDLFIFFSALFYEEHTFAEIAVPTIMMGLDNISNVIRLNGTYLWYNDRGKYSQFYNPKHVFLHAWKVTSLNSNNTQAKDFFCRNYLPYVEGRRRVS